jgi:outer membrane cobalamin receptor
VLKIVMSVIAAGCLATAASAQQGPESSGTEAYELPEVIVDAPNQAASTKKPKPQSSGGTSEPASGQSSASGEPEPIAADAAGAAPGDTPSASFSDGGGASVGNAPAVSSAGFTSGRIVEQVGTVDEVTAEQIERVGARTLDEAIRLMPGVHVRNGGDGVPRIDIRGMRTRNIIILVDGVPQNGTYDGQFDPRAIPVENIARIKVTRGGSSVLYGPGGNAAVIDIITKAAGPGLRATGDTMVGFGQQKDARVTASYGGGAVSTFISASIYEQDQFHLSDEFAFTTLQPNDARVNSDREDRAIYGNTQIKVNEDIQWGFSINYREGEYGKPPSTVNSAGGQGCRNSGTDAAAPYNWGPCSDFASGLRFERVDDYSALSLQTSGLIDLGGGLTLRPIAYFNNNNELTNRFDDKDYATQLLSGAFREDAETSIYGGGGQIAYKPDDNNLVTVALDAHREAWEATGFEAVSTTAQANASGSLSNPTCNSTCQSNLANNCAGGTLLGPISFQPRFNTANPPVIIGYRARQACTRGERDVVERDEDLDIFSAAAEYEVKLTSQLSGVVGAGWAEQHREGSSDGDYTYLAGLRYAFTEDTVLRGNVARKIRFPTLRNLYDLDGGNPDLQTEVTQNYEVGLDQRLPFINGLFSVTVFRIDAEDFIRRATGSVCDGRTFPNVGNNTYDPFCNFDKLRFQGVETNLAFSPFAGFNAQVGYTYLDASNEQPSVVGGTSTIDNEPEHKVMAVVSYAIGGGATLLADYQYVADSFAVGRDQIQTLELADYHLLNLGVTQDVGGAYQLYGRVENVLDENYESSFGFPEAGRVFFIGLRAKLGPG